MKAPRITIVQLDPEVPLDRFGGYLGGAVLRNIPAWRRPLPPSDQLGEGIIVLGGYASAHDRERWIQPVKRMMREAVDRGIPLLGIALGQQLLAEAFGGEVRVSDPGGGEHGPVEVEWLPCATKDPLLGRAVAAGAVLFPESHRDAVVDLPKRATALARTSAYPHQAFRVGSAVGLQFHPEASPELMMQWAPQHAVDPMVMRRSMRLVDDTISRNGSLIGSGFVVAVREYANAAAGMDEVA